jgi:ferredoxin
MKDIIDYAKEIFDAVGVINRDQKTFLIVALASKPDRDLDTFTSDGKKWKFPGFYHHFNPKIESLLRTIKEKGFKATQRKYSDFNIKEMALEAGIGWQGKNSLIIHPKFGPWLRFVVLEINTSFKPAVPEIPYNLCEKCEACLKACPVKGLLKPYRLTEKKDCLAYIELDQPTTGPVPRCNKCLIFCPVGYVPSLFIFPK